MNSHRRAGQLLGAAMLLAVAVASLLPIPELPRAPVSDKWLHLLTYSVIGLWYGALFPERRWQVFVAGLLFGGAIEGLQALTGYRTAEWLDGLADAAGLLLGLAALHVLKRWPRFNHYLTHVAAA